MDFLEVCDHLKTLDVDLSVYSNTRFANVYVSGFKTIVLRVQDGYIKSLYPESFKIRRVRFEEIPKRLNYIEKLLKQRIAELEAMKPDSKEHSFFSHVLNWSTTPGSFDSGKAITQSPLSKPYRKGGTLYRGVLLSPERFHEFKEKGKLSHRQFSSWSYSEKTAARFAKMSFTHIPSEGSLGVLLKKRITSSVSLSIPSLVADRPDFMELANAGYFGDYEAGTVATLDEVIVRPLVVSTKDIIGLWQYRESRGFKKIPLSVLGK